MHHQRAASSDPAVEVIEPLKPEPLDAPASEADAPDAPPYLHRLLGPHFARAGKRGSQAEAVAPWGTRGCWLGRIQRPRGQSSPRPGHGARHGQTRAIAPTRHSCSLETASRSMNASIYANSAAPVHDGDEHLHWRCFCPDQKGGTPQKCKPAAQIWTVDIKSIKMQIKTLT